MPKSQVWEPGAVVKVGFLVLRVKCQQDMAAREDSYSPRAWYLASLDGKMNYSFVPHRGLQRIPS